MPRYEFSAFIEIDADNEVSACDRVEHVLDTAILAFQGNPTISLDENEPWEVEHV